MKPNDLQNLAANLRQVEGEASIQETHISQVILTPDYAYKVSKTVKLPYLDFSTLEQRRMYCHQEIELNRKLTEGIYLQVVAISSRDDQIFLGEGKGAIIDYAVKMKRLPEHRLMSNMLKNNEVKSEHMTAIARQLVRFHRKAEKVAQWPDVQQMQQDFADVLSIKTAITNLMGTDTAGMLEKCVFDVHLFLAAHESRIQERQQEQYYVEIHGDLHAANIFLLDEPVIFDCIAFNKSFRQADLLSELAFFCMDLDAYHRSDLSKTFLQQYLLLFPCIETEEDQSLFQFYKLYRANVRLKVNALKWQQSASTQEKKRCSDAIATYYQLMHIYYRTLFQPKEQPYQAVLL